ncbi:ribonuclease HII [Bacillus lacus]|uniref:Ribonuclease HII n=1 Tax=Metabacillus lacus TaxID=1983721 RepID=A0A7X2IVI9_9BACI|nr:ribonuclease HII [Metabacillus lacus]MRX70576.1 ribonuclease HII [Metabacillus lacus]
MKLTVSDIQKEIKTIHHIHDPRLKEWQEDSRKSVQLLVQKWLRNYEAEKKRAAAFQTMQAMEKECRAKGFKKIAGIDEVGRGPLAGPVVAAAVILPEDFWLPGVNDSKKLTSIQRETYFQEIYAKAIDIHITIVEADIIDKVNIYQASKLAMESAVSGLKVEPDYLLVDAMSLDLPIEQRSMIKGDSLSISIAASSIVAKVVRDRLMKELSEQYPHYGFHQNMGYGTKEHLKALDMHGPSPCHRKSFSPVKEACMK